MSVRDSKIIKGIGILSMIFYHLFSNIDVVKERGYTGFWNNYNLLEMISGAGHVCVVLFVFVMSYGITIKSKEANCDLRHSMKDGVNRYVSLAKRVSYALVLMIFLSMLLGIEMFPEDIWGGSRAHQTIGILSNMFCVASVVNMSWYQSAWWFVSFAVLLYFMIPIFHIVVKKIGPVASLVLSVLVIRTLQFNVTYDGLPRYLICVVLGIVFAEYSLFERVEEELKQDKFRKFLFLVLLLIGNALCVVLIKYVTCGYIREAAFLVTIVFTAVLYVKDLPILNKVLIVLGKYSDYMWLMHLFVYKQLCKNIILKHNNIWAIWGLTILFSFALSFLLKNIQELIEKGKLSKLLCKKSGRIVFSLSWILCILCFVWVSTGFAYLTNDDAGIQSILSGETTGMPYITHQFINVILGFFVSTFYKLAQSVQWWLVYSLFMMALGIFLINYAVIKQCVKREFKDIHIIGFMIGIMLLSIYPLYRISFTMVPALLGTGLVAILFSVDNNVSSKKYKWTIFLVSLGYICVLIHRTSSGYALLCFILMGVLYSLMNIKENMKDAIKNFVVVCGIFAVITVVIVKVNSFATTQINGQDFVEYNAARIAYMDYPKDKYDDNPELYETAGWDRLTYNLVRNWCFVDESVTAESFAYLSENSEACYDTESYINIVKEAVSSDGCRVLFIVWAFTILCAIYLLLCKRNGKFILFTIFNNLGSLALIIYQVFAGRLIYRSLFVVLIPAIIVNVILSIRHGEIKKLDAQILKPIVLFMTVFSGVLILTHVYNKENMEFVETSNERSIAIKQYATEHPENTYIMCTSVYNSIECYTTYQKGKEPCNIMTMGGSTYNSDSYLKRLQVNGISKLDYDTFKLDNKYYLCGTNVFDEYGAYSGNSFTMFYSYLKNRTNVIGFVLDETIMEKTYSYRFVYEDNKEKFDSWYDIVDNELIFIDANY